MATIAYITMSIAIFLLCWYLFSPGAKELVEQDWKPAEQPSVLPTTTRMSDVCYIKNSADWRIVSWHAYDSIVVGDIADPKYYSWYKKIMELVDRLPTLQFERHPNESPERTLKLEHNSAILVKNIHDDMELYIGIRDGVIKVGRSLTEGSFGRTIPVEDTTSN